MFDLTLMSFLINKLTVQSTFFFNLSTQLFFAQIELLETAVCLLLKYLISFLIWTWDGFVYWGESSATPAPPWILRSVGSAEHRFGQKSIFLLFHSWVSKFSHLRAPPPHFVDFHHLLSRKSKMQLKKMWNAFNQIVKRLNNSEYSFLLGFMGD